MNPTLLVCDLEYAKKIKELGVVHESCFYWRKQHHVPFKDQEFKLFSDKGCDFPATYSAWTTTELGIMLPDKYINDEDNIFYSYQYAKTEHDFVGLYINFFTKDSWKVIASTRDKKEANTRAKMLIHLIENKHVTVEEINERLKGVRE
jgi:hypothetical protein